MDRFEASAGDTGVDSSPTVNPSVFVLLAGLWLLGASMFTAYPAAPGFDGRWNDRVSGLVLILVAVIRVLARTSTSGLSLINVLVGGWLIAAPFVLGYGRGPHATSSTWNDVVVGVIVVLLAVVSWVTARVDLSAER